MMTKTKLDGWDQDEVFSHLKLFKKILNFLKRKGLRWGWGGVGGAVKLAQRPPLPCIYVIGCFEDLKRRNFW